MYKFVVYSLWICGILPYRQYTVGQWVCAGASDSLGGKYGSPAESLSHIYTTLGQRPTITYPLVQLRHIQLRNGRLVCHGLSRQLPSSFSYSPALIFIDFRPTFLAIVEMKEETHFYDAIFFIYCLPLESFISENNASARNFNHC